MRRVHHGMPGRARLARSVSTSSATHWPDGTPKKFRGADTWRNWINYDSRFKGYDDELNRARHYFWELDAKGRLWKLELHEPGRRFGQMRHAAVLDHLFGHLQVSH